MYTLQKDINEKIWYFSIENADITGAVSDFILFLYPVCRPVWVKNRFAELLTWNIFGSFRSRFACVQARVRKTSLENGSPLNVCRNWNSKRLLFVKNALGNIQVLRQQKAGWVGSENGNFLLILQYYLCWRRLLGGPKKAKNMLT